MSTSSNSSVPVAQLNFRLQQKTVLAIETPDLGNSENTAGEHDRRAKRRFRIEQDVHYKILFGQRITEAGTGRTTDISSGGVRFTTETQLSPGTPLVLSLNWPVLLNGSARLKLMVYGCVVRSNGKEAVVTIDRYEFRTQGSGVIRIPDAPPHVAFPLKS